MDYKEFMSFVVGWCYVCNQGNVFIAKTDEGKYFCHCEECESDWKSPEDFRNKSEEEPDFAGIENLKSLIIPDLTDPTMKEWMKYVKNEPEFDE